MGPELAPGAADGRPAAVRWQAAAAGLLRLGLRRRRRLPDEPSCGRCSTAAASLEVLHVSALVHDDVMDASDLRRGRPAAHRQFEALHANAGWLGDSAAFGRAGAILLGDLLVMWSVQMLQAAGLRPVGAGAGAADRRGDADRGDLRAVPRHRGPGPPAPAAGSGDRSVRPSIELALDEANRVVEYKAARYTVQRPCQIGAALGGGDDELYYALGAYGSPLGRAFQFRDDLLGVFGDPQLTGKPAGDDLREGKRTVLVAHAFAHADDGGPEAAGASGSATRTWTPTGVAELQQVITESGAREAVETMITEGYERALKALQDAEMTDEGRAGLTALAEAAVRRET